MENNKNLKRKQTIAAIAIIVFVPAFIMIQLAIYSGKVAADYIILFSLVMRAIIIIAGIFLALKLYKEKSQLWILIVINFLLIFISFMCPDGLIRLILRFAASIVLLILIIKMTSKNKK